MPALGPLPERAGPEPLGGMGADRGGGSRQRPGLRAHAHPRHCAAWNDWGRYREVGAGGDARAPDPAAHRRPSPLCARRLRVRITAHGFGKSRSLSRLELERVAQGASLPGREGTRLRGPGHGPAALPTPQRLVQGAQSERYRAVSHGQRPRAGGKQSHQRVSRRVGDATTVDARRPRRSPRGAATRQIRRRRLPAGGTEAELDAQHAADSPTVVRRGARTAPGGDSHRGPARALAAHGPRSVHARGDRSRARRARRSDATHRCIPRVERRPMAVRRAPDARRHRRRALRGALRGGAARTHDAAEPRVVGAIHRPARVARRPDWCLLGRHRPIRARSGCRSGVME